MLIAHCGVRNAMFLLVIIFSRTGIGEPRQCNNQTLQVEHRASVRVELWSSVKHTYAGSKELRSCKSNIG